MPQIALTGIRLLFYINLDALPVLFCATFIPSTPAWVSDLGSTSIVRRTAGVRGQSSPQNVYIFTASSTDREYPSTGSDSFKIVEEGVIRYEFNDGLASPPDAPPILRAPHDTRVLLWCRHPTEPV
ncbi:hypothetical protein V8D89_015437 [Ganoderma adspersum]